MVRRDFLGGFFCISSKKNKTLLFFNTLMIAMLLIPLGASGEIIKQESIEKGVNRLLIDNQRKDALVVARKYYLETHGNYDAGILYSRALLANHELDEAIKTLDKLSMRYPGNPEINMLQAKYHNFKEIELLEDYFNRKNYKKSIKLGNPLFKQGINTYRTGLIVARSEYRLGHLDKALEIFTAMIKKYPDNISLREEAENIEKQIAISRAAFFIDRGESRKAINIIKPFFIETDPDKTIGVLLARAYIKEQENIRALNIYTELLKKYPQDASLSKDYMNFLLGTYHDDSALEYYNTLPKKQKLLIASRENISKYYTNYLMVYGGAATSTRNYPVDNEVGIVINKSFKKSALYLSVSRWNRFNQDSTQIEGVYYFALPHGYDAYVGGQYSPENNFIAHYSFSAGISKSIKNINVYGSIRQLEFTALSATVLSGGLRYYFSVPASLGMTLYYVPQTAAYSIMLSPEWRSSNTNQLYSNISWGMAGENLGINLGILNTPSVNFGVGDRYRLTAHVQIGVEAFMEYRKALYNRVGGLGYIRYWW